MLVSVALLGSQQRGTTTNMDMIMCGCAIFTHPFLFLPTRIRVLCTHPYPYSPTCIRAPFTHPHSHLPTRVYPPIFIFTHPYLCPVYPIHGLMGWLVG